MTSHADMVAIRLIVLGRGVQVVTVPTGSSLGQTLGLAGIDPGSKDLRVNGREAQATDLVGAKDLITIIPRIRGGSVTTRRCLSDRT